MDGVVLAVVVAVVAVVAIAIAVTVVRGRATVARSRIEAALAERGAREIEISNQWLDFDRDTLTFNVTYRTRDGRQATNRCKVPVRLMAESSVYWEEPLEATRGSERG